MAALSNCTITRCLPAFQRANKCYSTASLPEIVVRVRDFSASGSRKSRHLRADGFVPGVLYGLDDDRNVLKHMITVPEKDLKKELRTRGISFENTLYQIRVDGDDGTIASYVATPKQTQFNPVTTMPMSVNFLRHLPTNRIRIPIRYTNEDQSVDLKRGCFLVRVNNFIECVCDDEVPADIVVDLAGASKGDVIRLSSLQFPAKVRPAKTVPADFVASVVKSTRGK